MRKVYSHSRRSTLVKCARQYFYECYAAGVAPPAYDPQMGLFSEPEPDHAVIDTDAVKEVSALKELSNSYQAAGLILHELIGLHWKHVDWSPEWFIEQAEKRFDAWVIRSQNAEDNSTRLLEHYYSLNDAGETITEARRRLQHAMSTYMTDETISDFVALLRAGDEILTEQPIGGLPKIRGFTIMGRIDVACRFGSEVRVVDWKMGASVGDEDSLQLTLYGWWATEKFNVSPENVIIQRVFLGDGTVEGEIRLSARMLERGRARLLQDVERMRDLQEYGEKGIFEAFPPCEKEKICHQCKYQGICPAIACETA